MLCESIPANQVGAKAERSYRRLKFSVRLNSQVLHWRRCSVGIYPTIKGLERAQVTHGNVSGVWSGGGGWKEFGLQVIVPGEGVSTEWLRPRKASKLKITIKADSNPLECGQLRWSVTGSGNGSRYGSVVPCTSLGFGNESSDAGWATGAWARLSIPFYFFSRIKRQLRIANGDRRNPPGSQPASNIGGCPATEKIQCCVAGAPE